MVVISVLETGLYRAVVCPKRYEQVEWRGLSNAVAELVALSATGEGEVGRGSKNVRRTAKQGEGRVTKAFEKSRTEGEQQARGRVGVEICCPNCGNLMVGDFTLQEPTMMRREKHGRKGDGLLSKRVPAGGKGSELVIGENRGEQVSERRTENVQVRLGELEGQTVEDEGTAQESSREEKIQIENGPRPGLEWAQKKEIEVSNVSQTKKEAWRPKVTFKHTVKENSRRERHLLKTTGLKNRRIILSNMSRKLERRQMKIVGRRDEVGGRKNQGSEEPGSKLKVYARRKEGIEHRRRQQQGIRIMESNGNLRKTQEHECAEKMKGVTSSEASGEVWKSGTREM